MKKVLLAVLVLGIVGCGGGKPVEVDGKPVKEYSKLKTKSHDGHLVIVYDGYRGGGVMHHPDCPCLSK